MLFKTTRLLFMHRPMKCVRCAKPASLSCAACKSAAYCSVACQTADWTRGHASVCCHPSGVIVVFEVALQCPKLSELLKAMPRLRAVLPASNFTLFAPTNAAIQAWGGLENLKGDSLDKFLMHHVIQGAHPADHVKKMTSLTPLHGDGIRVQVVDGQVRLGTEFSAVVGESVECENGIFIHKISHPLLHEYTSDVGDIEQLALENTKSRRLLKDDNMYIELQSVRPNEQSFSQTNRLVLFIRVERGRGVIVVNGISHEVSDGDFFLVEKTGYSIQNHGTARLQLSCIYAFL